MTKKELVELLNPLDDDVKIVVALDTVGQAGYAEVGQANRGHGPRQNEFIIFPGDVIEEEK